MNTEKLNSWLTLVANFGVLLGIALLVYELRQTQHLAETDSMVGRLEQMQVAQTAMALSDSLPEIRVKAQTEGIETLTALELYRLRMWELSVINRMRSQYILYKRGYLDERTARGFINTAVRWLPYWESLGFEFEPIEDTFEKAVLQTAGRE